MDRKTAADSVFEQLHDDIISLRLAPGARVSEVEIAKRLDVSRQPVREAFIRLHNLSLLQVRPQRATEIRRISESAIKSAQFVRMAVEIEVLKRACIHPIGQHEEAFEASLQLQKEAMDAGHAQLFNEHDLHFHELLCRAGNCEFAFATISAGKSQVSRVCLLSLDDNAEMPALYEDHRALYDFVRQGREVEAVSLIRSHLSRIDSTLRDVRERHSEYFENH